MQGSVGQCNAAGMHTHLSHHAGAHPAVPAVLCCAVLCCAVQATAAGVKEVEAINLLEKKYKSGPQYSQKEAVELAISTLQVRVAVQAVQAVAR